MKIGILGGVFNPPHVGHLMIAQQVLDFTDVNQIWFLPNYGQHPPKPNVASVSDRLAMTKLLDLPKSQVSTIEIDKKLDGNTINLLPFLPKEHEYTFIIGSDCLASFHQWGSWRELLKKIRFLVFPRNGFSNEPLYEGMKLIQNENLIVTDISSTKIRERVRLGLPIDQFVPKEVAEYIKEHGLYK